MIPGDPAWPLISDPLAWRLWPVRVYFNIDYKYLNVETKMKVGPDKFNLDLNPRLVAVGVGYRF